MFPVLLFLKRKNLFCFFHLSNFIALNTSDSCFMFCKTKQLGTDLFLCSCNLLTYHFSLCFGVFSLSPFVPFDIPFCSSSLFQSVFLSQADSNPVLPYGLEEFPNGHSDLYNAAWKLWVFFFSSSSSCLTFLSLCPLPPLSDFLPTAWLVFNLSRLYSKR